jgi:hypothetical protein
LKEKKLFQFKKPEGFKAENGCKVLMANKYFASIFCKTIKKQGWECTK